MTDHDDAACSTCATWLAFRETLIVDQRSTPYVTKSGPYRTTVPEARTNSFRMPPMDSLPDDVREAYTHFREHHPPL